MQRGSSDTPRWILRLAPYLGVSLGLHLALLAVPLPSVSVDVPLSFTDTIELGIEPAPHEPLAAPPAPPAPPTLDDTPETPPPPRPAPAPRPPRVRPPRVSAPPPPVLPDPPEPQLQEPTLGAAPPVDAGVDVALALNDDASVDVALALNDDAGADAALALNDDASVDVALALNDDAGADAGPRAPTIPAVAGAAGDLAAAIPAGSVVTLLLRTDRMRDNPNAPALSELLSNIRDWRAILGNTEVDPLRDFDQVLMASANPFPPRGQRPDLMAVVRSRAPRGFLRASIEQMAGARDPSLRDADAGPSLRARFEGDAGAPPRASRNIWTRRGTSEVTTVESYLGPTSVMLLAENLAVIAPPEQVPTLLAILGARRGVASRVGAAAPGRAGRLVTVVEARNVRALVRAPGGERLVPSQLALAVYVTSHGGAQDGGAELVGSLEFDTPQQAEAAARVYTVGLDDAHDLIDANTRDPRVRIGAAALGVSFGNLHSALRAVHFSAEGASLRIAATLSPDEVAELLHLQRLAPLLR
ncbi:MAG: hypothetical protein JNK72_25160 [Myxococcales bacterium]|nr:hypothetical protein [Myxococcales bacterium]